MIKNKDKLNPDWVTGLVDAEGCFYVRFSQSKNYKTGWWVQPCFQLGLHKDKDILIEMKSFFNNCGGIYPINHKGLLYQVRNPKDIINIIIHFNNYPLITQKQSDFILFKNIV